MKNLSKKKKVIISIIALIIIVGVVLTATIGLNYSLRYQDAKKVELYLQKDFETSDIKQITKEVFQNKDVIIQKVEVFEDSVSIITKDITDEQKADLIKRINEKYKTQLSEDSVKVETIPNTRGRDIIKPYIAPVVISTIIISAYMAIRYNKLNSSIVVVKTICGLSVVQLLLLSVFAITRIPVGILTMPLSILVYIVALFIITSKFENKLNNINKSNKKKNKK